MPTHDLMTRSTLSLFPDPSRTVLRPFDPTDPEPFADPDQPRAARILDRVLGLGKAELADAVDRMTASLRTRHRDVDQTLVRRAEAVTGSPISRPTLSFDQTLLLGAFFSEEYSFESAALFNPSIILHPDQSGLTDGTIRFALSLRGIGEGHISSVTFRTGTWGPNGTITIDPASGTVVSPQIDDFDGEADRAMTRISCLGSRDASESVLFPVTHSQSQGIEDLRMVRFIEDDGSVDYLGTYTAFSGSAARTELMRAHDFRTFEMWPLHGSAAAGKGMALFPRRIDGRYAMLARQDNEAIWLVLSDDLYHWDGGTRIILPQYPWEFVQMGNCGSPIEIDEGWLVLTHGVGTVRNYCIGACLLDRTDPSKVIARTPHPLLSSGPAERDGYVPNVVYSCGGIVHRRDLLLPYGVADTYATFATISVDDLLGSMV